MRLLSLPNRLEFDISAAELFWSDAGLTPSGLGSSLMAGAASIGSRIFPRASFEQADSA